MLDRTLHDRWKVRRLHRILFHGGVGRDPRAGQKAHVLYHCLYRERDGHENVQSLRIAVNINNLLATFYYRLLHYGPHAPAQDDTPSHTYT